MRLYQLIALDHAAYVDDTSGFAAYIVQDDDPEPPSDWADELEEEAWETYHNGDVYAVIIVNDSQEWADSLWGIYDDEYAAWETTSYTRQCARDMLADAVSAYVASGDWVTI